MPFPQLRLAIILFSCLLAEAATSSTTPWDQPFSADTSSILKTAASIPPSKNQKVIVLLDDRKIEFDKAGRQTLTLRMVVRLTGSDAAESPWASVDREYAPWRHHKPELRARVITAKGEVLWLDPKTIAETAARDDGDATIYTDDRIVQAPLPGIGDGCVIETEVRVREHQPFFDRGVAERHEYRGKLPKQIRVIIESPSELPLRVKTAEFPKTAVIESEAKKLRRTAIDWTPPLPSPAEAAQTTPPAKPQKDDEDDDADDDDDFDWQKPFPVFSFSTGTSWTDIATRYEQAVENAIRAADLKTFMSGLAPYSGSPRDIATRLAARLHENIRYTGIEFGEAAIVPVAPATALERKFGDCKDKAALLVAMLREAGIPAHVALLQSAIDTRDVDEDLPGLGVFNHTIVYVAGDQPLWIDATADTMRIGDLPPADEGRWALIASSNTKSLVKIPESTSAANRIVKNIDLKLKPAGRGDITETATATGAFEWRFRASFSGVAAEDRKEFERVTKELYLAKNLGEFSTPKRADFTPQSYSYRFTSLEAQRASTDGDEAAGGLFEHFIFDNLPWALKQAKKPAKPSTQDTILQNAFQAEYNYVLHPPAGFKPRPLPKSETFSWGPAKYERKFATRPTGEIEVTFRFDSGKRRYTPEESEQVRQGVSKYVAPKPVVVSYVSDIAEAIALGDLKSAVSSAMKLVQADGGSAGLRIRLSNLLLQVGAGDAARQEARKATELDPQSARAFHALGWALQHDSFGRRFAGDWDRDAALAAHRKSTELDPKDRALMSDLAILLEHNRAGIRYAPDANCDEAEKIYRKRIEQDGAEFVQRNLAALLLWRRNYDGLEKQLEHLAPKSKPEFEMLLAAAREGAGRAAMIAQQNYSTNTDRGNVLLGAARTLLSMREYKPAMDLMKAAARLLNNPQFSQQTQIFSSIQRREDITLQKDDPKYPVMRLLQLVFGSEPITRDVLVSIASKRQPTSDAEIESFKNSRREALGVMRTMERVGIPKEVFEDFILSAIPLKAEGEEKIGFRVSGGAAGSKPMVLFVAREDGEYRLMGAESGLELVGERILDLAEAGDLDSARKWLDLVAPSGVGVPSNEIGGAIYGSMWSGVTPETRGKPAILLAAAAMTGQSKNSPRAITILQQGLTKAANATERSQIQVALAQSYKKAEKWKEMLDVSYRLETTNMFANEGRRFQLEALMKLERWADVQKTAGSMYIRSKDDLHALRALLAAADALKDQPKIIEYSESLGSALMSETADHIRAAWGAVRFGKSAPATLKKLSENQDNTLPSNHYYVKGFLQLAEGSPDAAIQSLTTALDRDDFTTLDAQPWILQGKILEHLGLTDAAARSYARKTQVSRKSKEGDWAASLAK